MPLRRGPHDQASKKRSRSELDPRHRRRHEEKQEIDRISKLVAEIAPHIGLAVGEVRKPLKKFSELPLSNRTLDGLAAAEYTKLTPVQRMALPQALRGVDALVAAPTGSGKTLAFAVPAIERLWREKWSALDGLGALILAPTRELGVQIFEVVSALLSRHHITAGLIIGGKDLATEQRYLSRANILVATPGRLLQHMDESVDFSASNLRILVLDEADRVLDLGFERTVTAILKNLPSDRQTLLFSATQTKSVKSLARLSLQDPQYIAVKQLKDETEHRLDGDRNQLQRGNGETHASETREGSTADEEAQSLSSTPKRLTQFYAVTSEGGKLNALWSFITTHLKAKILVFMTSSKQVRFVYEALRRLRPGTPLMHLFGRMKLAKRTSTYGQFCKSRQACLFATDVAARGLDFPDVDWVIQLDCPDSLATYIHRVGRTARYTSSGRAVLFLLPSELKFVDRLTATHVPVKKMRIRDSKLVDVTKKINSCVASDPDLKYLAQRAVVSYVKAVHLFGDREVFDVHAVKVRELAYSFGLASAPKIKLPKQQSGASGARSAHRMEVEKRRAQNEFGYRVQQTKDPLLEHLNRNKGDAKDDNEDEDLLTLKRSGDEVLKQLQVLHTASADARSADSQRTEPKKKKPRMKLTETGVANDALGSHQRFDDEDDEDEHGRSETNGGAQTDAKLHDTGTEPTSSHPFADSFEDEREQTAGVDLEQRENYVRNIRARIDSQRKEARQLEKERVREKHVRDRRRHRREDDLERTGPLDGSGAEQESGEEDLDAEDDIGPYQDYELAVSSDEEEDDEEGDGGVVAAAGPTEEEAAMRILEANAKF